MDFLGRFPYPELRTHMLTLWISAEIKYIGQLVYHQQLW